MGRKQIVRLVAAGMALALMLVMPNVGRAQSTHGAVVGTVSDESGAVMPGVTVTVTNMGTNIPRTVITNQSGYFEATALVPGTYRVHGALTGFKPLTREGIVVESRATVRIDFSLGLGAQTTEVTVVAGTPVIETETASIADTRTAVQIEALPMLATGTLFPFVTTLPGVQVVGAAGSTVFSFNGARSGQSELMFDGMSSARLNTPLAGNPNTMEMTSEIKIHSASNNAEFASPGVVNLVSKSGTNDFHGTAFYYTSRAQWNEHTRFQKVPPAINRHNYGATLSGPVMLPGYNGHDKTFFMASFWGERNPAEFAFSGQVPTAAMRTGNLSNLSGTITDPLTGQPFPGNIIPANRISSISQALQNRFLGLPNVGDPNLFVDKNWQVNMDRQGKPTENRVDLRIDQRIGQNNMLFARYNRKSTQQWDLKGTTPTVGATQGPRAHTNFVMSDTHTFGSTLINEARFGFTRGGNSNFLPIKGADFIKEFGLTNYPSSEYSGIPIFEVSGIPRIGSNSQNHLDDWNNIYQFTDMVTWTRSDHTFKTGVDVQYNNAHGISTPNEQFGLLSFTGLITGNAYADFLLGLPATTSRATYLGANSKSGTDLALFVQDSWRVSPKLTLEGGLRYEYQFKPIIDDNGRMFNFDPATGNLVVPDDTLGSPDINPLLPSNIKIVSASSAGFPQELRNPQKGNIVPRVGFAWRPTEKMAIRGGYGIFIDSFGTFLVPPYASPLFGYTAQFKNTATSQPFTIANPFGATGSLVGALVAGDSSQPTINPNIENPRMHQWSLSIEREIMEFGVRVSYVGTRSTNLTYTRNIDLPAPSTTPFTSARLVYPQFSSVMYSENGDGLTTQYHALQTALERRFGQSFYIQAAWTMAKHMEDVADIGREVGPTIQNPYDVGAERARSENTPTHRINGALIWEIPVGKGRRFMSNANRIVDAILGGWRVSSLFYYDTGKWSTPTFSGTDPSATGTSGSQRPDIIGEPNLPSSERTVDRWFDASAFAIPASNIGRFGTSGRNVIEGPSSKVVHMSLSKKFALVGRTNLQLQVNALNVFNIENLDLNANSLNMNVANKANVGKLLGVRGGIESFGARTVNVETRLTF